MIDRLPADLLMLLVKHDMDVRDIVSVSMVSRSLYDVMFTRQVWQSLAQNISKTRPLALSPFESLAELDISQLLRLVKRSLAVDEAMSQDIILPLSQKRLFSLSTPVLFTQALPGGRYLLLALEGGDLLWWDTQANALVARHQTNNSLNLMRRVVLDTDRREFVLGMVFANMETCEPSGHLMRLSVLRLIPASTDTAARIEEYPSYPISFPITSIFVQPEYVGLVGLCRNENVVHLLLLRRDNASVTCLNTGIQVVSCEASAGVLLVNGTVQLNGKSFCLSALVFEKEIILYLEDASGASAYYYDAAELLSLSKRHEAANAQRIFPPKLSRDYTFVDAGNSSFFRYFEASDIWREAGISCLSTLVRTSDNGEREHLMAHHYFSPRSPESRPLERSILSFDRDERICVTERGVELLVLGIYGRHVAWLAETDGVTALRTVCLTPKTTIGRKVYEIQITNGEEVLGSIDSMDLDDAFGILYLTTTHSVYRIDLS